jgi:hypothetical protein
VHNEKPHNLYGSPDNVRVIKLRKKHVARMREKINAHGILVRKPGGNRPTENLGVDGKI